MYLRQEFYRKKIFSLQAELADIIGGYTTLYSKDLVKDAEAKFSENMKKLILPRLKKGILPQSFMIHIGKSVSSLLFRWLCKLERLCYKSHPGNNSKQLCNAVNQSEFEAQMCKRCQARKNLQLVLWCRMVQKANIPFATRGLTTGAKRGKICRKQPVPKDRRRATTVEHWKTCNRCQARRKQRTIAKFEKSSGNITSKYVWLWFVYHC